MNYNDMNRVFLKAVHPLSVLATTLANSLLMHKYIFLINIIFSAWGTIVYLITWFLKIVKLELLGHSYERKQVTTYLRC
jgi:hypothetical protein